MKINQQLSELHALAEGIDKSNLWNVSITLIVLFLALCFAPISIFLKIIIYSSVSAVTGAIDNATRKQAIADLKTQLYLRGLYYLYREGDLETSDKKELEELEELNKQHPLELYPQHDFNGVAKTFLVISWIVSLIILGFSGYIPTF